VRQNKQTTNYLNLAKLADEQYNFLSNYVDAGLRHTSATPDDYKNYFLMISRQLAYATKDDSWGEFEKQFAIIVARLLRAERVIKKNRQLINEYDGWDTP
jgi:hypothetical protein